MCVLMNKECRRSLIIALLEVMILLKHEVEINVNKKGRQTEVLKSGEMTLRDRVISALFGRGHKMLVLIPADSVHSVAIKEVDVETE